MNQDQSNVQSPQQASGCGCGRARPVACTLAAPQPYVHACHPAPLHRHPCQSSAHFTLSQAYGM